MDDGALHAVLKNLTATANRANFRGGRHMGHAYQYREQVAALLGMSRRRGDERLETVCEIGFNAGHSAAMLLSANNASIHDFDLMSNPWSKHSVGAFRALHPGRLHLHVGDSACTAPDALRRLQRVSGQRRPPCDRFFVDGWHEEPSVSSDLSHALLFTRPGGLVMADDASRQFPEIRPAWERLVQVRPPDHLPLASYMYPLLAHRCERE